MMLRHAAAVTRRRASSSLRSPTARPLHTASVLVPHQAVLSRTWDPFFQQVRWKRRDGNKAFSKERPPTKKQRKAYNRKLQALDQAKSKHGRPGSKAGERREFLQAYKEDLLNDEPMDEKELLEYGMEDALLDDLMGNAKELGSQATPEPVYLGHRHDQLAARLRAQMDNLQQIQDSSGSSNELTVNNLPDDRLVSLTLRAYRDKYGTRRRPVGLVAALQHLLQDLSIPIGVFGELTYTTLLTCCRTPNEGRRVLQLMQQQGHVVSSWSWSILVDLYAKVGDYQGCGSVLQEMLQAGMAPTLPAYTSLLAACYKICADGRNAPSVRAKAAKFAAEKWREMRVVGIDPDAMAYGAMLRVCAAQGRPEQALNLLEEMQQMQVKPTTLCFTSALRAVARSHATAIRFENGASKRNLRREFITKHHGKLARQIVILAENAEVELDDGFISALILCAGEAGDTATAKAIYVASQIRKLDHFRTIGSDAHLARLRGEDESARLGYLKHDVFKQLVAGEDSKALLNLDQEPKRSFGEREYGKDSRVLSAVLHACAKAVDQSSIGTMWQGRENQGYLCENSLRLLVARRLPRYEDTSIPGQQRTADLTWEGEYKDEDYRGDKRRQRKFSGVDVSEDGASTLDELDDMFARIYVDEDGRRKEEFRQTTPEDIWRAKYGKSVDESLNEDVDEIDSGLETKLIDAAAEAETEAEELVFDYETMRWITRPRTATAIEASPFPDEGSSASLSAPEPQKESSHEELYFDSDTMRWKTRERLSPILNCLPQEEQARVILVHEEAQSEDDNEEMYFDSDSMRWKTRPKPESNAGKRTDFEASVLQSNSAGVGNKAGDDLDAREFAKFYVELQAEIKETGMDAVDEDEARELFVMMREEYDEVISMDIEDLMGELDAAGLTDEGTRHLGRNGLGGPAQPIEATSTKASAERFSALIEDIKDTWREQGADLGDDATVAPMRASSMPSLVTAVASAQAPSSFVPGTTTVGPEYFEAFAQEESAISDSGDSLLMDALPRNMEVMDGAFRKTVTFTDYDEHDARLEELREMLPALPDNRLRRIIRAFEKSLSDPSLLDLIPIVRERMPDYITATWLKQMSSLTARYVMRKASQEGLVDVHMLNGVLELEAQSGSLDRAIDFYETEFGQHQLVPNEYSNRLLVQMFLKSNRFARALDLKRRVNEEARSLDIISYGSLVEFCGRHGHVGSAIMLLKECLSVHGAPPGEAFLSKLRILCRKEGIDVTGLIGEDPLAWLKKGEAQYKREMSKKGRRDVLLARNRVVQI